MEKEELARIQKYHDLIKGSGGRIDVLTREEQQDLQEILGKSLIEQGVATPEELAAL